MKAHPTVKATQTSAVDSAIAANPNAPVFKFKEESWDFGQIPQGTPVTHVFTFDNSGKEPLIVSQSTASCGCTTPEWTKEPVLSGKSGTVKVTFNAAKEGAFNKTITVLSNTASPKYLTIKGTVLPKPPAPATTPSNEQK
ncbi:MAG: DUF1573 domain-containing protein [Chitinophagaceae bacterium]|nr:DUF1573 domain-containing protein [Chitinophagaceae bacterium]